MSRILFVRRSDFTRYENGNERVIVHQQRRERERRNVSFSNRLFVSSDPTLTRLLDKTQPLLMCTHTHTTRENSKCVLKWLVPTLFNCLLLLLVDIVCLSTSVFIFQQEEEEGGARERMKSVRTSRVSSVSPIEKEQATWWHEEKEKIVISSIEPLVPKSVITGVADRSRYVSEEEKWSIGDALNANR